MPAGPEPMMMTSRTSWSAGELTSIFMCDGLGHGPQAAEATAQHVDGPYRFEVLEVIADARARGDGDHGGPAGPPA